MATDGATDPVPLALDAMQRELARNQEDMVNYVNAWARRQTELMLKMCSATSQESAAGDAKSDERTEGWQPRQPTLAAVTTTQPLWQPVWQPRDDPEQAAPKPALQLERCEDVESDCEASEEGNGEQGHGREEQGSVQRLRSQSSMEFREIAAILKKTSASSNGLLSSRIHYSQYFEITCSSVIVINALYMAYLTDRNVRLVIDGQPLEDPAFLVVEVFFALFYTCEALLRAYVTRLKYLTGPDWKWNLFDVTLVVLAWYDLGMQVFGNEGGGNLSFLRVMRLMKMSKLLRLVRIMKSFRELRLIVASLMNSMKSMFWATLLILLIAFMFGIVVVQAVTAYLLESRNLIESQDLQYLLTRWGNLPNAVYSLYIASMGGGDWEDIANSLVPVGLPYFYLFLLYIGFFFCVITNTLTSLFVETTMADADKDQQMVIQAELEAKDLYVKMLEGWYAELDEDGSGDISLEEFMKHAEAPEMVHFAAAMDINVTEMKQFFTVLSSHGRRPVTLDTFVVGCIKLKGMAKSMDLMDLSYSHKQSAAELRHFIHETEVEFRGVDRKLNQLSALVAEAKLLSPQLKL